MGTVALSINDQTPPCREAGQPAATACGVHPLYVYPMHRDQGSVNTPTIPCPTQTPAFLILVFLNSCQVQQGLHPLANSDMMLVRGRQHNPPLQHHPLAGPLQVRDPPLSSVLMANTELMGDNHRRVVIDPVAFSLFIYMLFLHFGRRKSYELFGLSPHLTCWLSFGFPIFRTAFVLLSVTHISPYSLHYE